MSTVSYSRHSETVGNWEEEVWQTHSHNKIRRQVSESHQRDIGSSQDYGFKHSHHSGRCKKVSVSLWRLWAAGLTGPGAARKHQLRHQNKKKRLVLAMKHYQWTSEDWKKVLWTDESKLELFGSSRRIFVHHRVGERMVPQCVTSTVRHGGGSVMVWGCLAGSRVGDLSRGTGTLRGFSSYICQRWLMYMIFFPPPSIVHFRVQWDIKLHRVQ